MRVFLSGGTGYIGAVVLDALVRAGHEVTTLVRSAGRGRRAAERGARIVVGDLGSPAAWREHAAGHDAYVHTAFEYSARGAEVDRTAIETFVALGRQRSGSVFVYTSGIWVLGNTREPADESAPLNPPALVQYRPAHEAMVLEANSGGLRTVVVRPGIVYGGARGIVSDLIKDAQNGLIRVVGSGENHWPLVYDRDLAELYARLVARPDASGVFHANDEGDERVVDLVEAIANGQRQRPDVRHIPLPEARAKLGPYADALALDQIVRSPRARALGWTPTIGGVARNVPRLLEEWRRGHEES